jgi:excisionase family DNA binding protein
MRLGAYDQIFDQVKADIIHEITRSLEDRFNSQAKNDWPAHMTVTECASYLHVSVKSLRRAIKDQSIPVFRVRNRILIRRTDVDRWIQERLTREAPRRG